MREKSITERNKNDVLRNIVAAGAVWDSPGKSVPNGGEISFEISGRRVAATLQLLGTTKLMVTMIAPVRYSSRMSLYPVQMRILTTKGTEYIPDECLKMAKIRLLWLYGDWLILRLRREKIAEKLSLFDSFLDTFPLLEAERIKPLKERLAWQAFMSGQVKKRFKKGLYSQQEYVEKKRPYRERITELIREMEPRNPFRVYFEEELSELHGVPNIDFMRSVASPTDKGETIM